jgi:hypothetical protein
MCTRQSPELSSSPTVFTGKREQLLPVSAQTVDVTEPPNLARYFISSTKTTDTKSKFQYYNHFT